MKSTKFKIYFCEVVRKGQETHAPNYLIVVARFLYLGPDPGHAISRFSEKFLPPVQIQRSRSPRTELEVSDSEYSQSVSCKRWFITTWFSL